MQSEFIPRLATSVNGGTIGSQIVLGALTMTVQTANYAEAIEHLPPDSTLVFNDVAWEEYEGLLDDVGEASGLRISYDSGRLQVITLSMSHERYSEFVQDLVRLLSLKLRIRVLSFGSMTMKKSPSHGLEPDKCFYVQTAPAVEGKDSIDLATDPPPDVAVEIDLHHQSVAKFPIYASLGVPEIWRYDGISMKIHHLERGEYLPSDSSRALPMFSADILTEFLTRVKKEDQYETLLAFEQWLQSQSRER